MKWWWTVYKSFHLSHLKTHSIYLAFNYLTSSGFTCMIFLIHAFYYCSFSCKPVWIHCTWCHVQYCVSELPQISPSVGSMVMSCLHFTSCLNQNNICHSSSSIPTAAALPARQEVTSGTGVHGDRRSGAEGLFAPVEQRPTLLSGDQLFHPAGLQAAGVPKCNVPAAPPALCATGRPPCWTCVCLSVCLSRYVWYIKYRSCNVHW